MENNLFYVLQQVVEKGFGMADMDVVDKYVSKDVIEHQFGRQNGRDALKKSITTLAHAFSERKYELVQHCVVGDKIWGHYLYTAVHTGTFFGNEATGKKVNIDVMDIVVVKNNQVVEHWGVPDKLTLLIQIGAITFK
jgi:predicted ester cyclase